MEKTKKTKIGCRIKKKVLVKTRTCNEVCYTKTNIKKVGSKKSVGESVALIFKNVVP